MWQVADLCGGMMLEISQLRAQIARCEQEQKTLEERLVLKFRERYEPLVRHLYCTCIKLKVSRPDGHCRQPQAQPEMFFSMLSFSEKNFEKCSTN